MSIRLVALDLDGTLVNDQLEVSPKTLATLQHLIQQTDVRVVLATGRMYASTLPFAQKIGIQSPLVVYQGAMVKDFHAPHEVHLHQPLDLPLAQQVMAFLLEEKCHTNLYIDDQLLTNHSNEFATYYARVSGVTPQMVEDLLGAVVAPPTKIMAIDDHRIDIILEGLLSTFPNQLSVCKSRKNFCEIIHPQASKWEALSLLAKQWEIPPEEIMAIGDQGNDISMIRNAGVGVAMGNASPEVQALADFVTLPIGEDGAAYAIERFVLNGESVSSLNAVEPLETV